METKISNNWKFKIEIKHLFSEETTPELINKLCSRLNTQLVKIKSEVQKSNLMQDEINHLDSELEICIDNFEFLSNFATGNILEKNWQEYSFTGDYEGWFNDYFEQLYDLGDSRVITNHNISEKFIWIG